ncbi:hypothetical protein HNP84_010115 [Thermocatellispora tengchongensis]|uniref:Thiopeptide-type bacteriocin biosynthesis domain-containing protein n=1 Tax=Thermocatellispora tengchongensis TaxID=1073253 RepID=A0A840PLH0_9ACTN|nr:thiopeptide maturation pyridine synthase [Thermocatellispora tengchongensis]MBB5140348.1 hypothetical protein [Thermocatellispora tengchongensis]
MGALPHAAWHCVHVYYHAPDKDGLLLDAVRPLFREIRAHVEAAYVLRHWRQGPHLRLNVRTDRQTWEGFVRPRIDQVIGDYLRRHPSTTVLDQRESLAWHRLLAIREQERGPLTPWHPDNSIRDAPFDPRGHVLGGDAAVELLTTFYSDSTPLLFAMLDHARAGRDSKRDLAVNLLLTAAYAGRPLAEGLASCRAHAEAYITWSADPGGTLAAFDREYRLRRTRLVQRVRHVLRTLDGTAPGPHERGTQEAAAFVREWAALLARYARRPEVPAPRPPSSRPLPRPVTRAGDAALDYTYLHLERLGLTSLQRFSALYQVARAAGAVAAAAAAGEEYVPEERAGHGSWGWGT